MSHFPPLNAIPSQVRTHPNSLDIKLQEKTYLLTTYLVGTST